MFPGICRTQQIFYLRTCWTPATSRSRTTKLCRKGRMRSRCHYKLPSGFRHQAFKEPSSKTRLLASRVQTQRRTAGRQSAQRYSVPQHTCTIAFGLQMRKEVWTTGSLAVLLRLSGRFWSILEFAQPVPNVPQGLKHGQWLMRRPQDGSSSVNLKKEKLATLSVSKRVWTWEDAALVLPVPPFDASTQIGILTDTPGPGRSRLFARFPFRFPAPKFGPNLPRFLIRPGASGTSPPLAHASYIKLRAMQAPARLAKPPGTAPSSGR